MEENRIIDLDLEDIEDIERAHNIKCPFPAVYISGNSLYYNIHAMKLMGYTEYVNYGVTTKYVVITPTNEFSKKAFHMTSWGGSAARYTHVPAQLKEKKLGDGVYRLLPASGGRFAFDRYAPIDKGAAE